jgi:hypothetical protein
MKNSNSLLADIRELTVELHNSKLGNDDHDALQLCVNILKEIRAYGVPSHVIRRFMDSLVGTLIKKPSEFQKTFGKKEHYDSGESNCQYGDKG